MNHLQIIKRHTTMPLSQLKNEVNPSNKQTSYKGNQEVNISKTISSNQILNRDKQNIKPSILPSTHSSTQNVKKLTPVTPEEQIHNIKTNVGRLTICKKKISKIEHVTTSNNIISHLKIVRRRQQTSRSIFDNQNNCSLSIKQKINEHIRPLNSNQFVKGENGKWIKLAQVPKKKISISQISEAKDQNTSCNSNNHLFNNEDQSTGLQIQNQSQNVSRASFGTNRSIQEDNVSKHSSHQRHFNQNDQIYNQQSSLKNQILKHINQNHQQKHSSLKSDQNKIEEDEMVNEVDNYSDSQYNEVESSQNNETFDEQRDQNQTDGFIIVLSNVPFRYKEEDIRNLIKSERAYINSVKPHEQNGEWLISTQNETSQNKIKELLENKTVDGQILIADLAYYLSQDQLEEVEEDLSDKNNKNYSSKQQKNEPIKENQHQQQTGNNKSSQINKQNQQLGQNDSYSSKQQSIKQFQQESQNEQSSNNNKSKDYQSASRNMPSQTNQQNNENNYYKNNRENQKQESQDRYHHYQENSDSDSYSNQREQNRNRSSQSNFNNQNRTENKRSQRNNYERDNEHHAQKSRQRMRSSSYEDLTSPERQNQSESPRKQGKYIDKQTINDPRRNTKEYNQRHINSRDAQSHRYRDSSPSNKSNKTNRNQYNYTNRYQNKSRNRDEESNDLSQERQNNYGRRDSRSHYHSHRDSSEEMRKDNHHYSNYNKSSYSSKTNYSTNHKSRGAEISYRR